MKETKWNDEVHVIRQVQGSPWQVMGKSREVMGKSREVLWASAGMLLEGRVGIRVEEFQDERREHMHNG